MGVAKGEGGGRGGNFTGSWFICWSFSFNYKRMWSVYCRHTQLKFLLQYHSILHWSNIYDVQWFLSHMADRRGHDVERLIAVILPRVIRNITSYYMFVWYHKITRFLKTLPRDGHTSLGVCEYETTRLECLILDDWHVFRQHWVMLRCHAKYIIYPPSDMLHI